MIVNLHKLGLTYNHIYEAYIVKDPNYTLNINYDSKSNSNHFLIIRYNSPKKCNITLKINDNIISNDLLNTKTKSLNKLISFNLQLGPYKFKKGNNKIKLICQGNFPLLYELQINDKPQINNSNFIIEKYFKYRMSDFILLENYNIYGGFYWHIYNYIICNLVADKLRKIPIINFNGCLYKSNTNELSLIHNNSNWFYNYFKDTSNLPPNIHNTVLNFPSRIELTKNNYTDKKSDEFIYLFGYNSFGEYNKLCLEMNMNEKRKYIQSKLKLCDYLLEITKDIKKELFPEKINKLYGIHYRGTDKVEEMENDEEHPIHYQYESIYEELKDKLKDEDNYLVITTDEIPFIRFMKDKLGNKIIDYKNANRSNLNTSGLNYNFQITPTRDKLFDKRKLTGYVKQEYILKEKLINNSIHMGHKHLSNYKKGLDCIIDVLMLQDCDVIYKSKGNFSNFCFFLNTNPNLKVIELHECI